MRRTPELDDRPQSTHAGAARKPAAYARVRDRRSRRCTVATEDANDPVVVEGTAALVRDTAAIERFLERANAKYHAAMTIELLDPDVNTTIRAALGVRDPPRRLQFSGSPTR